MVKKNMVSVLVIIFFGFLVSGNFLGCVNRNQVLRIFNWEDYMAPGIVKEFEQYYLEQTGKKIKVQTSGFATNEQMYTQIATKKVDFDLIVPSDYMVDRMIKEDLLMPIDHSIVYGTDGYRDIFDDSIVDVVENGYDKGLQYSVPYMWGTVGILYDPVRGPETLTSDVRSWESVFGDKYKGRIYMQDSVVDAFAVASIVANSEKLMSVANTDQHQDLVSKVINDTSPQNIQAVREQLVRQRPNLLAYATDDANDRMAIGNQSSGFLAVVWSVQAGYAMADNQNLRYSVPDEGSNTWIDSFAITKQARNVQAANLFLKFINKSEIALQNMDYIGASTAVTQAREQYQEDIMQELYDLEEESGTDSDEYDFLKNYFDLLFPDKKVMGRVAAYQDWGEARYNINLMWIQVKSGGSDNDRFGGGVAIMLILFLLSACGIAVQIIWNRR
ncbi:MAG: ABC transporter substrate-binding protein [Clostridiales bacterium]|jgi:spermidine/putrescine transport system substrate-binding protein|nr:ABC transporter substrate-binding protein [Clostridiales bacterium]